MWLLFAHRGDGLVGAEIDLLDVPAGIADGVTAAVDSLAGTLDGIAAGAGFVPRGWGACGDLDRPLSADERKLVRESYAERAAPSVRWRT